MNKYIYPEAVQDYFPEIRTISARSYKEAFNKLVERYSRQFEDDDVLLNVDNFEEFQEHMNSTYTIAIGDLVDIETI